MASWDELARARKIGCTLQQPMSGRSVSPSVGAVTGSSAAVTAMNGMMDGMGGMGLLGFLILVALILGIVALFKYITSRHG